MAKTKLRVFKNIGECLTLNGALAKSARRTTEADLGILRKAAIVEEAGRITWIGAESRLSKSPVAGRKKSELEEIDFGGRTVMPAFTECHTHLVFAGHRTDEFELRNRGASYQEIADRGGGILATVRPTRKAPVAKLAEVAQARADAFVRQGVSTIECKSGYALTTVGEMKILEAAGRIRGPRIVRTYLGPHAVPPESPSAEAYIESIIANDLPQLKKSGRACRVDIFVEAGYFSESVARKYLAAAQTLGFDIAIHADQLTRSRGARLAVEFSARSAEHLIMINESDVRLLASSETACVLLPAADLYLKCAYPPARALLDAGARVAIATDFNPGSSPTQSLSLVGVLSRLEMKMTLPEVIVAYTLGGAFALGFGRDLGALAVGRFCDMAVLDSDWTDLFYSIGEMPVHQVWREGKRLFPKNYRGLN